MQVNGHKEAHGRSLKPACILTQEPVERAKATISISATFIGVFPYQQNPPGAASVGKIQLGVCYIYELDMREASRYWRRRMGRLTMNTVTNWCSSDAHKAGPDHAQVPRKEILRPKWLFRSFFFRRRSDSLHMRCYMFRQGWFHSNFWSSSRALDAGINVQNKSVYMSYIFHTIPPGRYITRLQEVSGASSLSSSLKPSKNPDLCSPRRHEGLAHPWNPGTR